MVIHCEVVPYRHTNGPSDVTWHVRTTMVATELPFSTIIKGSWQVEERETIESDVYDALKGTFGTPDCSADVVQFFKIIRSLIMRMF